jgi:hypothetical protein
VARPLKVAALAETVIGTESLIRKSIRAGLGRQKAHPEHGTFRGRPAQSGRASQSR